MPTTVLHSSTIAYIVQNQPDQILDCSQIDISIQKYNQQTRIRKIRFVDISVGGSLVLECTPYRESVPQEYVYEGDPHPFIVQHENPFDKFILQAVPTVLLFPSDNTHGLHKSVPLDPPYHCTQEETHQLLQIHIPDLPPEVIQHHQGSFVLTHRLTWPCKNSTQEPTYTQYYSIPSYSRRAANLGRYPLNTGYKANMGLYPFRNSIVLQWIVPTAANLQC